MIPMCRALALSFIALILLKVTALGGDTSTAPKSVELICEIGSVSTLTGNQSIVIPVHLINVTDSVDAFQLWITSSDVNIIRFAVDSVGGVIYGRVDTTGTRSRGGSVIAHILDSLQSIIKIEGHFSPERAAIPPGSGILIKLIAETNGTPDSGASVRLSLDRNQSFFLKPDGHLIGCVYDTLGECAIDTTRRVLIDSEVRILLPAWPICGDVSGDSLVNISDAVCLICHIFLFDTCPFTEQPNAANANGDAGINISDAVYLISYIFGGGPAPHCGYM